MAHIQNSRTRLNKWAEVALRSSEDAIMIVSRVIAKRSWIQSAFLRLLGISMSCLSGACQLRQSGFMVDPEFIVELDEDARNRFAVVRQADLVIEYDGPDQITLSTQDRTATIEATEQTLVKAIVEATTRRKLAVVIFGKQARVALPESQMSSTADMPGAILQAKGFTRVIFQLYSGWGRPVYREQSDGKCS